MNKFFQRIAKRISIIVGSAGAFIFAFLIVLVWATTGPLFGFSDTWQLVINTSTTILTFLMVFLIQNTQNRDAKAVQLKLDELIFAIKKANNDFIDLEELPDDEMDRIEEMFRNLRNRKNG